MDENQKGGFRREDCSLLSAYLNFLAEGRGILRGNHKGCPLRSARLSTALFLQG